MKKYTILVVDDDEMITATLSKVVSIMLKQNVIAFNNPVLALECIKRDQIQVDLVISDFIMPELNGIEFLRSLKELFPDIISILLTGYADKQNAIKSINEIGIFNYMEKPWDNDNLIATVQNGLDKKRLTDALNGKVIELEQKAQEIKLLYSRLEEEYRKETERNITLEIQVAERTSSIRNLLDNAGQGFLSFGRDMIIHKDYSAECRRLFGTSIYGMDFASLLFPGDAEQQDYVRKVAGKILALEDQEQVELYLPLMPDIIVLNGFTIHFEYKLIKEDSFSNEKKIMAILTDITERCVLENQMEQEKNTFKMVVKVVTSHHDFLILVSEFQEFLRDGIREIIYGSPDMQEAVNELFRRVHTFKGNFAMMNMQRTVDTLHQAEDVLSELKAAVNQKSRDELFFVASAMDLQSGYQADIQTIRSILGDQYGQTESLLQVNRATLHEIEEKMAKLLKPCDFMALAPSIRAIAYKSLESMLAPYLDYVIVLSEKYGKLIHPVKLMGCEIKLNPERYSPFIRALVHVFRNAVIHGIEKPEERVASGKDATGSITCEARIGDEYLEIAISDDGRGICMEAVRCKAKEHKILTATQSAGISDAEILRLIICDSFSTSEIRDQNTGRGVGLSALNQELIKLGGSMNIISEPLSGTRFEFQIPYRPSEDYAVLDADVLLEPAVRIAICQLSELTGNHSFTPGPCEKADRSDLVLNENTVFINIDGQMEASFFLTLDKKLSDEIVKHEIQAENELSYEALVQESLTEVANVILGNCLGELHDNNDFIVINTPYFLNADSAVMSSASSEISLCRISSDFGNCCVGLIKKW